MQRKRLPKTKTQWYGQPVYELQGSLAAIEKGLPQFSRERLAYQGSVNDYLDLVLRDPEPEDARRVPVSTVSQQYVLIQHTAAINWLRDAFKTLEWNPEDIKVTAWLSEYGERMRAEVVLPVDPVQAVPGDKIGAQVCIWNSVDRSRAFEIAIRWLRLICINGLAVWHEDRLRIVHLPEWMGRRRSPVEFLKTRLPKSRLMTASLQRWLEVRFEEDKLAEWASRDVAKRWGKQRAERVLHILRTGCDYLEIRARNGRRPSTPDLEDMIIVPGAPDRSENAYDIYQALLWVAGTEKSVEQRESRATSALHLVNGLVPEPLRLRAA
jgi:Domain of unknown function (DUF932)